MNGIQVRGTYAVSQACIPHMKGRENPHILSLSPPLNITPRWLGAHTGYTLAKYGMTLLTLGWAAEYAEAGVAANCLWPRTSIGKIGRASCRERV